MSDTREIKRVRQACLNCRRKKVRCSGERPVCAFCSRLGQQCLWDDSQGGLGSLWRKGSVGTLAESDLATRVALLESQLSSLNNDGINLLQTHPTVSARKSVQRTKGLSDSSLDSPATDKVASGSSQGSRAVSEQNSVQSLPSHDIIRSLVDTYFIYSHNQPYCWFHEASFRQRLEAGALPEYLVFAVLATAVRFSDHETFVGRQQDYIYSYSQAAWTHLLKYSFSFEDVLDTSMVQSMAMLASIDFTAGHQRLGWVKIGLSVRFAQGLRLYQEPSHQLRPCEQEELRRTFWSVYILDRLVSTGPNRPPTFVDEDCTVQLPCHEQLYKEDLPCGNSPTLSDLEEKPDHSYSYSLDNLALGVLMSSSLAKIIRYSMKREIMHSTPPWDHRSQFSRIYSALLYFESYSVGTSTTIGDTIARHFTINGIVDQHRAGQFIFSRALYHLNQCLLHHPFLLHQRFLGCRAAIPPSFVTEVLRRSREHASQLSDLLYDARQAGCVTEASYYGYCALATGIIHKLFTYHDDSKVATAAKMSLQLNLGFLERQPIRWETYGRMAIALRNFTPEIPTAKCLVTPVLLAQKSPIHEHDTIWRLIDYGWLSDATNDHSTPHGATSDSFDLEELNIEDDTVDPTLLIHKAPNTSAASNEMKNILGDDMGALFSELLGYGDTPPG